MVVIFPVISQTSTDAIFQLIPGQRSLPDRIPRDEYVYIPEEETNDPSPNLNIHSLPPQSNFDIPPLIPKVDKFLMDSEPINLVSPPKNITFTSKDGINKDFIPEQYHTEMPDKGTVVVDQENTSVPTYISGAEKEPGLINTHEKPDDVSVLEPEYAFLVEKISPQYIPVDTPSEVQNTKPNADTVVSGPSDIETVLPKNDVRLDNPSQTDITSRPVSPDISPNSISNSKIKIISVLGTGTYIQVISYNKLPSTDMLMQHQLINVAKIKGKLNIYKSLQSKYYRVLIGPFSISEVGVELLRWRKNGFDDAYVVYRKR